MMRRDTQTLCGKTGQRGQVRSQIAAADERGQPDRAQADGATVGRRLFNKEETAEMLGICVRTLDELAKEGKIKRVKIGARVMYDLPDIDAFIEAQKEVGSDEAITRSSERRTP